MQVLLTLFILPIPNKFEKKIMKLFKKYFGILIHKTENKYCGNKKSFNKFKSCQSRKGFLYANNSRHLQFASPWSDNYDQIWT